MIFVTRDSDLIFTMIMLLVFAELASKTANTFSCTALLTSLSSNELVNLLLYSHQDLDAVTN